MNAAGSDVEHLRDILGPSVSRRRLRELLQQASGSVQRAVELYFGAGNSSADVSDLYTLDDQEAGTTARQSSDPPAPARRGHRHPMRTARQSGTPAWQTLAEFVELSSSTDNDFDPSEFKLWSIICLQCLSHL